MKNLFYPLIVAWLLCAASSLSADIVITVEVDPPVLGGDIARVSFFGSSSTSQQITGINLPVDIGPAGTILPTELSFLGMLDSSGLDSPSVENEIGGVSGSLNTSSAILSLNNTDAVVNVTGFAPVTLSSTDSLLFDLLVQVAPGAAPGSFPVFINSGDTLGNGFNFGIFDGNGQEISLNDITVAAGSVNIVPEPSSAVLVMVCGSFMAFRRRR